MSVQQTSRLPNDWVPLSEVVELVTVRRAVTETEAGLLIRDAARDAVIFTRGRFHHQLSDPSFLINPAAWAGMFPDFALSRLFTHSGKLRETFAVGTGPVRVSVTEPILPIQLQFLNTPHICDVRVHWGSVAAWMDGAPRPEIPSLPTFSDTDTHSRSQAIWGNPLPSLWPASDDPTPQEPVTGLKPGVKRGKQSSKETWCLKAAELLKSRTVSCGRGATASCARLILNSTIGNGYQVDTIQKAIGPTVREISGKLVSASGK
jgi:hypothetical protein